MRVLCLIGLWILLGSLGVKFAQGLGGINFSAVQRRRYKHLFEPEGGLRVGLLGLLLLNQSLVFSLRVAICH